VRLPQTFSPSRLTLGTVQLGLAYGVANKAGLPTESCANEILSTAVDCGISTFDTARAYGISEERIGRWLSTGQTADIITKLSPLPPDQPAHAAEASLATSLALLRRTPRLVLVHREADLLAPGVEASLAIAIADGRIGGYGASVTTIAGAIRILNETNAQALQLPASLADRRFERAGVTSEAQKHGVSVFSRSAFLQGALLMAPDMLPRHLQRLAQGLNRLDHFAKEVGATRLALLLNAMTSNSAFASTIVGCESASQLSAIAASAALSIPALPDEVFEELGDEILDPWRWPRT
jgi:aryl-alcohol dehydrogenase-like predicted oxidoreductase